MLLCILHKLVIGFAVVGVINGVFIQETFKVASSDNQIMMRTTKLFFHLSLVIFFHNHVHLVSLTLALA